MLLMLGRFNFQSDCTIGRLTDGAQLSLYTMEPPRGNDKPYQPGLHCVPPALYDLIPYNSPTKGYTWCLHNPVEGVWAGIPGFEKPIEVVHGHTVVEIHIGNAPKNTHRCILVGTDWSKDHPDWISHSGDALDQLRTLLHPLSSGHQLQITERWD